MANFNFSQEELQASDRFNDGVAGIAKNIKVYVEEAGVNGVPENTNPNAPGFRLVFEDENGNKINKALFDIKKDAYPNTWGQTYEQAIKKEWQYLNKVVEHTGGTVVLSFDDDVDLYRKVGAAIGTGKLNVACNYGTQRSHKKYLEPRKFLPAVEPANTPDDETKLGITPVECLAPLMESTTEEIEDNFFGS